MPQEQPRLYTGNSRSNPGEKLLLSLQSVFLPGRFTAIGIGNDGWSWLEGKGDVQRPEELFGDVERGGAANLPHKTGLLQLNLVCHEHLVVSINAVPKSTTPHVMLPIMATPKPKGSRMPNPRTDSPGGR